MTPTNAAIWFIESHLDKQLTLKRIAEVAQVSPEHLWHEFLAVTGETVMGYVRARRMTDAGDILAAGDTNILTIALRFGYSSHEAFSRAFKDVFGASPKDYRKAHENLSEKRKGPMLMAENTLEAINEPRMESRSIMRVVGVRRVYSSNGSAAGIPSQWQEFAQHIGHVPGQLSDESYGVCRMLDDGMEYVCGVEVTENAEALEGLHSIEFEPQNCAVFKHDGHISTIRRTWSTIFQEWLPEAEFVRANAPDFEWYSADFDPITGNGRVEIWIPLETK